MDLTAICEALKATQETDGEARRKAEEMLDAASTSSPNQLVLALAGVLAQNVTQVADPLRQEAAVILRQLVNGLPTRESVWEELEAQTKTEVMAQLLKSIGGEDSKAVRRNVGQVAAAIATIAADDFDELNKSWPELLPTLSQFVGVGCDVATRVIALGILKDLIPTVGEGLLAQGPAAITMLASQLADQAPEVRAAGCQLVLGMVEMLGPEDLEPVKQVMPAVVATIQGLASGFHEELLKETLEVLISAAEEEAEFVKNSQCLKGLTETLLQICGAGAAAFADEDIRTSAMEAVMALAVGLSEDVAEPQGLPLLEHLVSLNLQWMMEVEEDVDAWTKEGQDKDDDDCDQEVVGYGEENLDKLAETFEEEVLMPLLFRVIRRTMSMPDCNWKHARSCIMALAQVIEYLEEEAWVSQCVEFIIQHLGHAHPRVRYSAFWALGQACYDQSPDIQENFHETLLPKLVVGIDDPNIRVATAAVSAFCALGEELDSDALEPQMDDLLQRLFNLLHRGESMALREHCLSGIAVIAEASEDNFTPYYSHVMPMLKEVITKCTKEEERSLHGKAFECISLIGAVVGKEIFLNDACEVMTAIMPLVSNGFAADDPRREAFYEAAGKIAETLGKDFKPFVQTLLPSIFRVLEQRPTGKGTDDDSDGEDAMVRELGLKTSVLEEMESALELTNTLIQALEDDFCEFMPLMCQHLLPFMTMAMSEDLREICYSTWECLAACARSAVENGRMDISILRELVTEFLKKSIGAMVSTANDPKNKPDKDGDLPEGMCTTLQAQAAGVAKVVKKAGMGVLSKDAVKDLAGVIVQMMDALRCPEKADPEPGLRRRRGGPVIEEDSDGDEKEEEEDVMPVTTQSVRFALVDVIGALMRSNPEEFVELALCPMMDLVKMLVRPERSEADRSLGFYLADDVVACLGEKTKPFWNGFMNEALLGMLDKSPIIRQFSASTIGSGASQAVFAQVVPAACNTIHQVLQKHGERHRRRRAVKADAKQNALAIDTCIQTLGQICQHQEAQMGNDAGTAWAMWLSNLPLKYNADAGKATHDQLVDLVMRNHPYLTKPEQLPRVLTVFAEIFRSKFSHGELDKKIAAAVCSLPEEVLQASCGSMPEKLQKKVEQMVKSNRA
mmetsp:Transcript_30368/g.86919  ORF Transcript_30368/g.86919 Transcript_30368/m.86919 type:complete len:1132 (-) Transcript_30368:221-3616(-)